MLALALLAGCSHTPRDVKESRFLMGTLVTFTISDAPRDQALTAIREAAAEMRRIERAFTIYGDAPNAVKAFNASPVNQDVRLPAEVSQLLETSLTLARESGGAFSPALGAPDLLWGFSRAEPPHRPPDMARLHALMQGADWRNIVRHGQAWRHTSAAAQLDFGGIAKGYAIDRAVAVLKRHGITHAIVDAGGDMRILGNHHGRPWRIGLRHPRRKNATLGWFEASGDIAIVTSGDYERFFIWQGRRYHHILDPATGLPARKSMSATIVAKSATLADGWSTALFVAGPAGLAMIRQHGMQAVLMDAQGRLHRTPDMLIPFHPASETQP
jgi:thiamine biosynthesis lipoprotein